MRSTFTGEPRGWTVRVTLTPEQEEVAFRNIGAQRFAYNWAVATIQREYRGGDKAIWSAFSLRRRWYTERDEIAPWWAENSKEAYSSGIAQAVTALKNFQDGRTGKRPDRPRFPRFKKKVTARAAFTVSTGFRLDGNRMLVLPVVGAVRSTESLRRFRRGVECGATKITGLTLWRKGARWYVSLKYRITPDTAYRHHSDAGDSVVGVDLGVGKMLATTHVHGGDSSQVDRPSALRRQMLRSDAAGRRTKRRVKGSTRWKRAKREAAKHSLREADIRKDLIHRTTSDLTKTHGTVVVEDLAVKAMARGWIRKAAARSGMGEFRRQVQYKARLALVADRFYASSKTCSACGVKNSDLTLSDTIWICPSCGALHERNENAAKNLAQLGAAWMDGKTVLCAPHDQVKRIPRLKKAHDLVSVTDAHGL